MGNAGSRAVAAAATLLVFFCLWAGIAAHPWPKSRPAAADPRLVALAARERTLKKQAAVVNAEVAQRWAAYRRRLARRQALIASVERRHVRDLEQAYVAAVEAARAAAAQAASARAYAAQVVASAERTPTATAAQTVAVAPAPTAANAPAVAGGRGAAAASAPAAATSPAPPPPVVTVAAPTTPVTRTTSSHP